MGPRTAAASAASSTGNAWFLATPDGQQHGPVSKAELDRWVAEGRVQAHFNLFCQGWTEWQPAGALYPTLAQQAAMQQAAAAQAAMNMSMPGNLMAGSYPGMPGMPMADPLGTQMAGAYGMGNPLGVSPYASPQSNSSPRSKKKKRASSGSTVKAPAIALIVLAALGILFYVVTIPLTIWAIIENDYEIFGELADRARTRAISNVVGGLIHLGVNGVILAGSIKMFQGREHSAAKTAAILATIPCCSPCCIFSMPFGIWALVVLNNPRVESEFQ